MIAADFEDPDAGLVKACHLRCQEAGGFHRRLVPVIKIASNDQRVDAFCKAQIHDRNESLAAGVADKFGKIWIA